MEQGCYYKIYGSPIPHQPISDRR